MNWFVPNKNDDYGHSLESLEVKSDVKKVQTRRRRIRKLLQPRRVECTVCGSPFHTKHSTKRYCSDPCRKIGRKETNALREQSKRKNTPMRPCNICGKEFLQKTWNQLTCSTECARKRKNERQSRLSHWRMKHCATCGCSYRPSETGRIKYCSSTCAKQGHERFKRINEQRVRAEKKAKRVAEKNERQAVK